MTVGAPDQLCTCPCYCVAGPVGRLAVVALKMRAAEYASCLTDGEEIDGDHGGTDAEYIRPFAEHLPAALIEAGFTIGVRLAQGRVITIVRRTKETA